MSSILSLIILSFKTSTLPFFSKSMASLYSLWDTNESASDNNNKTYSSEYFLYKASISDERDFEFFNKVKHCV